MLKSLSAAAVAFALIAAPAAPSFAQMSGQPSGQAATTEKPATKAARTPSKKQSAQQQKMKDCAAKWGDYKKEKKVQGRAEHRKFMSSCLKA